LPVNVLLIIDNAPGHPKTITIDDENVQVAFLTLNTILLLQSLDQSIIRCVKASYTRQVFDMIRAAIDADPKVQVIGG
jgi:isocitrate dehydrogenase kinase/phosphatase